MPIHVFMMYVEYSISKFYTIYTSLYVAFFVKTFAPNCCLLHFVESSTMTFGRGQHLPYRKRAPPPKTLARTKTARKKARDHVKQEMEVDELPRDDDEFPRDDKDLENL